MLYINGTNEDETSIAQHITKLDQTRPLASPLGPGFRQSSRLPQMVVCLEHFSKTGIGNSYGGSEVRSHVVWSDLVGTLYVLTLRGPFGREGQRERKMEEENYGRIAFIHRFTTLILNRVPCRRESGLACP